MNKFLAYIKPQVNEIISDLFSNGYYPDDLQKPLTKPLYWDQSIPYASVKLHFDHADMKLTSWINAAEAVTGNEEPFNLALIELFRESITEQWTSRMEVLVSDGYEQLKLNHELAVA